MSEFLITTRNFPPDHGGIQSLVYDIASNLNQYGDLVVFADAMHLDKAFDLGQKFKTQRVGGFKILKNYRKKRAIYNYVKAHGDISLVLSDHWKSLETLPSNINSKAKIFCLVHGKDINHKIGSRIHSRMLKCLSKATHIISNSRFTTELAASVGLDERKVRTINPGVSFAAEIDKENAKKAAEIFGDAKLKFISVTRLVKRKSIDKVILALEKLSKERDDFVYVVAGEGEEYSKIKKLAKNSSLGNKIKVIGAVDNNLKDALLKESDVFLMPSVRDGKSVEGFGIAFVEAAMFGNICIGGKDGGAADAIKDGSTGVLCDGNDENSIYEALKTAVQENHLREMQEEALKFVKEFSWDKQIKKYLDLIK